jgi:hypothetical protein
LRYFDYLTPEQEQDLFLQLPSEFSNRDDKETLAYAVGAALYMPAIRPRIADDVVSGKIKGLVSLVIDLEALSSHRLFRSSSCGFARRSKCGGCCRCWRNGCTW